MDMRKGELYILLRCVVLCTVLYVVMERVFLGEWERVGYVYFYAILRYAV